MATSGIFTQDTVEVLHDVFASSGYLTQQSLEVLFRVKATEAQITQELLQVAYAIPGSTQSGIFTQDSMEVLHNVFDASGYLTQQGLEVLYSATPTTAEVTQNLLQVVYKIADVGDPSGIFTQDALEVLHNVFDASGYLTQQGLEVLYLPKSALNTRDLITQQLLQVAIGTGITHAGRSTQNTLNVLHDVGNISGRFTQNNIEILYSDDVGHISRFTQDTVSILHDVGNVSGRFTQNTLEVLYSDDLGQLGKSTQQALSVLHDVGNASGRLTQNIIEILYDDSIGHIARTTQTALSVLHDIASPSGRFTQNHIEILFSDSEAVQFTQDTISVLHDVDTPSGRFTQNAIEILYDVADHFGRTTQDTLSVLHNVNTPSGRFTQNFIELLWNTSEQKQFTQNVLSILHDVQTPSGRFTQNLIELLYSSLEHVGNVTQDVMSVLHDVDTPSGRFTQDIIEILYDNPPSLDVRFNLPVEKLQFVESLNSGIALVSGQLITNTTTTDFTTELNNNIVDDVQLLDITPTVNDNFSFHGGNQFDTIEVDITTAGDWSGSVAWEYWDGSSYVALSNVTDGTDSFRNLGVNKIKWTKPSNMGTYHLGSSSVRARVNIFTSIVTQPLARRVNLTTTLDSNRGSIPLEFNTDLASKETKKIEVDCTGCNIDCCGPCCCGCYPVSGFDIHFEAKLSADSSCDGPRADQFDAAFTNVLFSATGVADDCYKRLGLTAPNEDAGPDGNLFPLTTYVWSGHVGGGGGALPTNQADCWRIRWGCNMDPSNQIGDLADIDSCSEYQLMIDILKCSGNSLLTPCDNGDNLGNVIFNGPSSNEITVPDEGGGISGCSCDPHLFVYTGICFSKYECMLCENPAGFCFDVEIFAA